MTLMVAILQSVICTEYTGFLSLKKAIPVRNLIGKNQFLIILMLIVVNYTVITNTTIQKVRQCCRKRRRNNAKKFPKKQQEIVLIQDLKATKNKDVAEDHPQDNNNPFECLEVEDIDENQLQEEV